MENEYEEKFIIDLKIDDEKDNEVSQEKEESKEYILALDGNKYIQGSLF